VREDKQGRIPYRHGGEGVVVLYSPRRPGATRSDLGRERRPNRTEVHVARLDGQVAIVTGGGSGIGEATAVALVGRRARPLEYLARALAEEGHTAHAVAADVADADAVERLVGDVTARWGRVDVLVNSAGVNVPRRDLASVSVADWDAVLRINLTGTFLVTHAVLPVMREQGSGTVVNVSSIAGYRPMALTGPAYNAAKAGVNAFTESINLAERRHGIRACAVCPGEVATPILDKRPEPPSPAARATMLQPEDLAETVLFVATLPQRATVELLTINPTEQRDWTAELR
jgi:NADP-dependent 3-hydroxy acid dehydrogenase YdfG